MRRPLALLLVLAFVLTLTAPVRASWSCADGSPCVHDRSQGYVCPGKQCAVRGSCCMVRKVQCKHGALPGSGKRGQGPGYDAPDDCRFKVFGKTHLTGLTEHAAGFMLAPASLPPTPGVQIAPPAFRPIWLAEYTLGYRPPPALSTGSPRAPPQA